MVKAPARKKGYAGRYVRHELGKNRVQLLLTAIFVLGVAAGCSIAGNPSAGVLTSLAQSLAEPSSSTAFLSRVMSCFAGNAVLLLLLFLCGLGAVFQPVVLAVLFLRGLGFGVMGVYSYSSSEQGAVLYYLLVLLPEALLTVLLLSAAASESLRFSVRFFVQLLPSSTTETLPAPSGNIGIYTAKFVLFYLLGGSVALLSGVLGVVFSALCGG